MQPREQVYPWSNNTYFGVRLKGAKYQAQVRKNGGKDIQLGRYTSGLEAAIYAWEFASEKQRQDALLIGKPNPSFTAKRNRRRKKKEEGEEEEEEEEELILFMPMSKLRKSLKC